MLIKIAILASSVFLSVVGLTNNAIATSKTDSNFNSKASGWREWEEIQTQPSTRSFSREKFQLEQTKPQENQLFSEPFYEASPKPIRRYTLEPGTQGSQVLGLQQRLQVHGFDPGQIDSVFGSRTERALRAFQEAQKLDVTGIVDRYTWQALEADPRPVISEQVLSKGSKGSKIRTLQTRLEVIGYDPGPVDGIFGSRTQSAVIAYQTAQGLEPSGVVDEKTWKVLSQEWMK